MVAILEGGTQYDLTTQQAEVLVSRDIAYSCGVEKADCAFEPTDETSNDACGFYHLTVEFIQDRHGDDVEAAFNEIDAILGVVTPH